MAKASAHGKPQQHCITPGWLLPHFILLFVQTFGAHSRPVMHTRHIVWLPVLPTIGYRDSLSLNKHGSESQMCLVQFFGFFIFGWGMCVRSTKSNFYVSCLPPPSLPARLVFAEIGSSALSANSAMLQSTQGLLWRGKEQVPWGDWSPLKRGQSCCLTTQLPPRILGSSQIYLPVNELLNNFFQSPLFTTSSCPDI